jgi:hypothetical protein
MNPETVKAIQEALTPLAQKLGESASALYGMAVRQVIVDAWLQISGAVLFVAAAVGMFVLAANLEDSDDAVPAFWVGVALIAAAVCLAFFAAPRFLNPEWFAVGKLAGMVTR